MKRSILSTQPFRYGTSALGGYPCSSVGYIYSTGNPFASFTNTAQTLLDNLLAKGVQVVNKQLGIEDVGAYAVLPDGRRGKVRTSASGGYEIVLDNGTVLPYTGQQVATYKSGLNTGTIVAGGVIVGGLLIWALTRK